MFGRVAALASIGAGMVHVAAAADHTDEPLLMAGFELVAVLQVALGCLLLWRLPSRAVLAAGVALMGTAIGLWVVSRTAGLDAIVSGTHVEPVGFRDLVTVVLELTASIGLVALLRGSSPRVPELLADTPLAGVAGALVVALAVPATIFGDHSHEDDPLAASTHHAATTAGTAHGPSAGLGPGHDSGGLHASEGDSRSAHVPGHDGGGGDGDSGHGGHAGSGGHTALASTGHSHTSAPVFGAAGSDEHHAGSGDHHSGAAPSGTGHGGAGHGDGGGEGGGSNGSGGAGHPGSSGHPPGHGEHEPPPEEPPADPPLTDVLTDPLDPVIPGR